MKKWIPAAVLTIAAAALAGAALFTVGLEPVEDRSAALSGQIRAQEQENQIMYSTVQARETEATAAEAEAERLRREAEKRLDMAADLIVGRVVKD